MKVTRMGGGVQEEENRSSDEAAPSVVDAFREFREMLKDSETIDEFVNKNRLGEIDYEAANRRDPGYGVIIAGMSLFFVSRVLLLQLRIGSQFGFQFFFSFYPVRLGWVVA
tara:strand:+ start:220 stop:552 length:333 start_codon:yes stop_codon:yes gene_type:complete